MILWLDAQVSPKLCPWIGREFEVDVVPVRDLGLREAEDLDIFDEARRAKAVVLTKDEDFVILVQRLGPPPQVIWLTCGNVSNAHLKKISGSRGTNQESTACGRAARSSQSSPLPSVLPRPVRILPLSRFSHSGTAAVAPARACERGRAEPAVPGEYRCCCV